MNRVWVVMEDDEVHHVFESEEEAIEYGRAVAAETVHSVNVTNAMLNPAGETPEPPA